MERDRSSTVISYCNSNFNSHAHVERDTAEIKLDGDNAISTHTLTWSVTDGIILNDDNDKFQLTRSRGA